MSLEALRNALPEYAKDQKLNLGSLATEPVLSTQQRAGCFIVSALAARHPTTTRHILAEFGPQLSPEALTAAKAAASIMGMNNIYYRFTHMVHGDYATMPAKLRMNIMARPGVDNVDFELWSLAVSAINGCGMCMESHEKVLLGHGVSKEQVQAAARIAAVVHAAAVTLEAEEALAA
jgi:lipoyl-dependent peroxiredoxin subunit D